MSTQHPKTFPQLLSGFGPCIDTEEQHQWGRGSHPRRASTHTPDSPAVQGKARPWQEGGQRCQHPQTPLVPLGRQRWPGLAWPGPGMQDCPAPVERALVKFPEYALPGPGREQGQTPAGVAGDTDLGTLPHLLQLQGSTHADPGDRGQEVLSPGPQCIHWKGGRKGRGVYTFENCQPCRVMGDPNRITRQTCILPSILK